MKTRTLGFIGGGRITKIILQAFRNENVLFKSIDVFETNGEIAGKLHHSYPEIVLSELGQVAKKDIVFVALHPPAIMETLGEISEYISKDAVIISLAPKISIRKISEKLNAEKIVRMIPNATSFINQGFNPVCFAEAFPENEKQLLMKILYVLGKTFEVEEAKLESYAIVSAMLPTYFWFQWEKLEEIGQETGLSKKESEEAVKETMLAAIHLFYSSGLAKEEVIDLIPVKPIAEHEDSIREFFSGKLIPLYDKLKP
ncbi:MAG: NAD(P)-binding domain-containing protein [Bacteroidales bacterium]|nr:NAD(P)-binding domain-containing protein [Bacteroidales bacterium]